MENKKIPVHKETLYFLSLVLMALAVSMETAADLGVSMIVAPAYIFSLKFSFLTFGQSEYVIQSILLIIFCILVKNIKLTYFVSFITCILYGAILDLFRSIVPALNPNITPPGSMPMPVRIFYLLFGMVITAISVAMAFRTYISAQVYDFFVIGITKKFGVPLSKFKTIYDFSFLIIALIMSLLFFGGIEGIGVGTILMTTLNGILIGWFNKLLDKVCIFKTFFPKLEEKFSIE